MARSYGSFNERGDPERGRLLDDVRTQSVLNRRTSVHSQSGLLGGGGSSGHEDRYSDEDETTARHAARGSSSGENARRGSASGISVEESDGESYVIPISPVAGRRGSAGSSTLSISNSEELQEGVRKMEAISRTWTQKTLVIAYLGIFLISLSTSLESQTTASLTAYATSSFSTHSSISLVLLIQNVVNAVIKPPIAKIADVFGRLEAFAVSITFYILGYTQMAASKNIATYASAQIFYSVGATGVQILNQVFIADSSGLLNRGILSKVPDLPFLGTVWIGPSIAEWVLNRNGGNGSAEGNWRLGYAMWIVVLPLAFMPLAGTLVYNARKAKRLHLMHDTATAAAILTGRRGPHRGWKNAPILGTESKTSIILGYVKNVIHYAWFELDIGGLLLLSGGVALILIPLTMINKGFTQDGGSNSRTGYFAAMILLGMMCLAIFPMWETSKRCAPKPILSLRLLKQRTALAGCAIAFFYFMVFYFSVQPYMYSYLQVVQNLPVATAGRTTQTFAFVSTIAALTVSMLIRHSARCRPFLLLGIGIYMLGIFLMWFNHGAGASLTQILIVQVIVGVGGGFTTVPLQIGVQASAAHRDVGAVTAIFLTCLEMGGAVGSAVSGAIWTKLVPGKLREYLPEEYQAEIPLIFGDLSRALAYPVGSEVRKGIARAYEETMGWLLVVAMVTCVPLVPLALGMKDYRLDEMDKENERSEGEGRHEDEGEGVEEGAYSDGEVRMDRAI